MLHPRRDQCCAHRDAFPNSAFRDVVGLTHHDRHQCELWIESLCQSICQHLLRVDPLQLGLVVLKGLAQHRHHDLEPLVSTRSGLLQYRVQQRSTVRVDDIDVGIRRSLYF